MSPVAKPGKSGDLYLVVDLSGGKEADKYPVTFLAEVPKGGWTDEFKTEKLVLRRIEPGRFMMGSQNEELGRFRSEDHHEVTLTKVSISAYLR